MGVVTLPAGSSQNMPWWSRRRAWDGLLSSPVSFPIRTSTWPSLRLCEARDFFDFLYSASFAIVARLPHDGACLFPLGQRIRRPFAALHRIGVLAQLGEEIDRIAIAIEPARALPARANQHIGTLLEHDADALGLLERMVRQRLEATYPGRGVSFACIRCSCSKNGLKCWRLAWAISSG